MMMILPSLSEFIIPPYTNSTMVYKPNKLGNHKLNHGT